MNQRHTNFYLSFSHFLLNSLLHNAVTRSKKSFTTFLCYYPQYQAKIINNYCLEDIKILYETCFFVMTMFVVIHNSCYGVTFSRLLQRNIIVCKLSFLELKPIFRCSYCICLDSAGLLVSGENK